MQSRMLKNGVTAFLAGALAIFGAGCEDPLEPDEHPEAGGVVILQQGTGTVLATSVGANVAFDNPIIVPLGGVLEVEVLFLNVDDPSDLLRAFLPDEDEGESMLVTIGNEAIVEFAFHEDHGDFSGLVAGTTTATVDLIHGGHPDFESGELTVVVQ